MSKSRIHQSLNVWMNGLLVGVWSWDRTDTHQFEYAESWIKSAAARPLSLSLPITAGKSILRGKAVKNFFDNLLPDNKKIRQRISHRYQLVSTNVPDLLGALGRDCIGAIQILPLNIKPEGFDKITATRLTDGEVEKLLLNVTSDEDDADFIDDFRISLAGAQEKTALLWYQNQWHVPHGMTPTTHILKLPLGLIGGMRVDMSGSIENEWLCMRIMAALGFDVAKTEIAQFGTQKVLVVERFDRKWMGHWIARLPQEDFCQASGVAPDNKYEADGGPGMAQCLHILEGSVSAAKDKLNFVLVNLAFWLLAATDGHAKNFSISLLTGGDYRMTPMYDILSAWPVIGRGANQLQEKKIKMAMALRSKNAHFKMSEMHVRHWQGLAAQTGVVDGFAQMQRLVQHVPDALAQVEHELPVHFPEQIWSSIRDGMLRQQQRFLSEMEDKSS
ncbi:type II toxin-antitoxin system HipA family toxin [Undibacterium sp. TC4M20W]|uniref:type II toxin-antitoxin system HipA family toxin n=1 Tax=Undibacterium sp. TC4M20W TaxID=3413052 RepID=UPI003BF1FC8D